MTYASDPGRAQLNAPRPDVRASRLAEGLLVVMLVLAVAVGIEVGSVPGSPFIALPFYAAGYVILRKVGSQPIGWLLCGLGVVLQVATEESLPWLSNLWMQWLFGWAFSLMFALFTWLFILFPDGHASRGWMITGWVTTALVLGGILQPVVTDVNDSSIVIGANPIGLPWLPYAIGLVSNAAITALLVAATIGVVVRGRRATPEARMRFKPVLATMALLGVLILVLLGWLIADPNFTADGTGDIVWSVALVVYMLIPASFGVAITRYRLYDIDVVISRTFVYGSLAVFIGAVYVGVVVGIGSLVGSGGEPNAVLSVGATALVAVGFQPVRRRLERIANRLVFGRKATPYEVLSEFSRRVAATSDNLLDDAARSLAEGTRAERVVVSVFVDDEPVEAAASPPKGTAASTEQVSFPITDGGTALGSLDVFLPAGQQLQDDDQRLAEQLASGMGLALRNQLLTERLQARIEELRESRRRLVAVQDETRRRLERDLHDGAQQQLVALKVKLGLGRAIAEKDGATQTAQLLERLSGEADQAVDAMREFARGVYPPLLEAEGLASAVRAQARRAPIPVSVNSDGIGRYPREIEATVYFCVLEALRNTTQHANASHASITLTHANGSLEFQVKDNGAGIHPDTPHGVGLTAIADRLDALAGDLRIHTEPGNGTTLTGSIPVQAEVPA